MKKIFWVSLMFAAASLAAADPPDKLDKCVNFRAPDQKSVITVPVCTLGVDSSCKRIERVVIKVRYCPSGSDSLVETVIASLRSPPFLKAWNLERIPNQLIFGIGIIIIVNFADGDAYGLHREGIFLCHKPVKSLPSRLVSYAYYGTGELPSDTLRLATPKKSRTSAFSQMYWSEKGITFNVTVRDPLFDSSAPHKILEQRGIEIMIDPLKKRNPFPEDNIMRVVVPLSGKPYLIVYQPLFKNSETYLLKQSITPVSIECSAHTTHRSGFTVAVTVPRYLFRASMPKNAGFNIIAKTSRNRISSLVKVSNAFNHYSPLLWPSMTLQPKPLHKARWLIILVSFLAGFLISIIGYAILVVLTKDRPRVIVRCHVADKQAFESIKEALDRNVIRKEVSADIIGAELNMSARQVEAVVKKSTGLSFRNYAMYLRTEIVRERLRSSFSTEASIAESCGFRNVKELERWFRRFHHMAPHNFRKEQQVTQAK